MRQQHDLIQRALNNDELDRFVVGEPFYFLEARVDNEEPQNIPQAFDQLLLPHWREGRDPLLWQRWIAGMLKALRDHPDANRAIYSVANWLWYYHHCLGKKRAQPDGSYADLPELDLGAVALALQLCMAERKDELITDTRWAGAAWNSPQGIWVPLLRLARAVRDNLAGPDFVPVNA